ncbi:uncharacterized protein [Antedon mediterranea]|uniref:uncharacterized protein n=1 Tax=Antedon mediterranea TaxID=105859 RepID=UPI003AF6E112
MLVYIESKDFQINTFVLKCGTGETLARVKAKILHVLYGMARDDHQFRLRYKGQFLRDAYTLEDYKIIDKSIVKMIPMAKKGESLKSIRASKEANLGSTGQLSEVKLALFEEVATLRWREKMLADFKGLLFIGTLFTLFSFFTIFWYAIAWILVTTIYAIWKCPTYTHKCGFVGASSLWPRRFMLLMGILAILNVGASIALAVISLNDITSFECGSKEAAFDCDQRKIKTIYSVIFFALHILYLLMVSMTNWILFRNFKFQIGDILEELMVISRDVEKVIQAAKSGRIKEQRNAAFELATLATTGDDSKFRIVAEGGLDVLILLCLSTDESIQEYATEAVAELLTIPVIQDQFVEMGGVSTLSTLLHSTNKRIIQEAVTAISYIVSDSEDNKHSVVADRGLEDLSHAAFNSSILTQRYIAGIYLELVFNADIRSQIASLNSPTKALLHLCSNKDNETMRLALQTLELVAIESSDVILNQENLVFDLLNIPTNTLDASIYLLAGKILLYVAEDTVSCGKMLNTDSLKDTLMQFAKTDDPILQKVVAKVILCTLDDRDLAIKAQDMKLQDVLVYIRNNSNDRDAWNMADQGITLFNNNDFRKYQPMPPPSDSFGSTLSLRKPRPSGYPGSTFSLNKDAKMMGSQSTMLEKVRMGSRLSLRSGNQSNVGSRASLQSN